MLNRKDNVISETVNRTVSVNEADSQALPDLRVNCLLICAPKKLHGLQPAFLKRQTYFMHLDPWFQHSPVSGAD